MAFDIPYAVCVIVMAVLTGAYVILGGYMQLRLTILFKGMIMLVGIVAVIIAVLNGQGGFTQALFHLAEIPSEVRPHWGSKGLIPLSLARIRSIFGCCILTSLGTWGLPQMVHKFYAINKRKIH